MQEQFFWITSGIAWTLEYLIPFLNLKNKHQTHRSIDSKMDEVKFVEDSLYHL